MRPVLESETYTFERDGIKLRFTVTQQNGTVTILNNQNQAQFKFTQSKPELAAKVAMMIAEAATFAESRLQEVDNGEQPELEAEIEDQDDAEN